MSEASNGFHDDSEPIDSVHQEMEEQTGENRCAYHTEPKTANTEITDTRQEQCKRNPDEPKCSESDDECIELDSCCSQGADSGLLETLNHKVDQHEWPRLVKHFDDLWIGSEHMHNRISSE